MYTLIVITIIVVLILPVELSIFNGFKWTRRCCETNVNISLPIEGIGVRKPNGKCFCGTDCFKRHGNNIGLRTTCYAIDCARIARILRNKLFHNCWQTCIKPLTLQEKQRIFYTIVNKDC